jgi:alkylation response protein AidB-like acyl-CoA dehydrogenase
MTMLAVDLNHSPGVRIGTPVFGKPLGAMQHWQYRLGERATEPECARNLYQKAALRVDAGERLTESEASMAKVYATRLAKDLARDAIQVYGGY